MDNKMSSKVSSDYAEPEVIQSISGWRFYILPKDYAVFVATSGFWGKASVQLVVDAMHPCDLCQSRTFRHIEVNNKRLTGIGFCYPSDSNDVKVETIQTIRKVLGGYNP